MRAAADTGRGMRIRAAARVLAQSAWLHSAFRAPDDDQRANNENRAWIYRIGDECEAVGVPFLHIHLSAGAAHFSGVLCGRATWQGGIPRFGRGGGPALSAWLANGGVRNARKIA